MLLRLHASGLQVSQAVVRRWFLVSCLQWGGLVSGYPLGSVCGQEQVRGGGGVEESNERFAAWVADAPPGIQRLIEVGRVTFKCDDQALAKARKVGLTRFEVRGDYRFRYMTTAVRFEPGKPQPGKPQPEELQPEEQRQEYVTDVSVRVFWADVQMTHEVVLGTDFRPESPWKSPLVQHEFDHVSTSTDPRLRILVKEYLGAPLRFEHRWEADASEGSPVRASEGRVDRRVAGQIEQSIRDRLAGRIKEVERVIQRHYDWLDRATGHGRRVLEERELFFAPFYMPKTLEEMEFREFEDSAIAKKLQAEVKWREHYQWNALP